MIEDESVFDLLVNNYTANILNLRSALLGLLVLALILYRFWEDYKGSK